MEDGRQATCGDRIKRALHIRGMKQSELCQATKIPKSAISQYISGAFEPKQDRIYSLAKALDVSEAWLMGYDVNPSREQNIEEISTEQRFAIEQDPSEIMFALSRGGEQTVTDEMFEEVKQFAAFIAQREATKK